jgi:hypothetical protein
VPDEPYLDNPAGRLYWALQRFGSHRDSQIIAAWNSALNVEPAKVPRALVGVADLIEDTKRAYSDSDLPPMFRDLPERLDAIGGMLFQTGAPMTAAVNAILPPDWDFVLKDILNLSLHLNKHGTHWKIPDVAEVADLVQSTRDLMAAVTNSDALPPEIKALLLRQLLQVLNTLEQVNVYGPEKVRLDVLAVAATAYACEPRVAAGHSAAKVRSTFDPIKNWMATVLTAVAIVGNTGAAALNWDHVFQPQLEAPAPHIDVTVDTSGAPSLSSETEPSTRP